MTSNNTHYDFSKLLNRDNLAALLDQLNQHQLLSTCNKQTLVNIADSLALVFQDNEAIATDTLTTLFNQLFAHQNVELVRGMGEPEYFPASDLNPARIEFAHGFFASALHEVSHWCIAGTARRQLSDFGYWYAPDGRTASQQQAFERVEIKPQAIECLLTLACGRKFQVSQDNLFADFDTSASTFTSDVYAQVKSYLEHPQTLPSDAKTLLWVLLTHRADIAI